MNNESREKLHLENEILRIKLRAQTGGDIRHQEKDLPPEIEHIFLKNILAFEESYANAGMISLYDYIGKPVYRKPEEMNEQEIETAVSELTSLLFTKNITVDFGTLEESRDKYLFIICDLFPQQINDVRVSGIFLHFQYEEFHPDHDRDMRARTLEFISDWFERSMGKYSWELAAKCALPDGSIIPKEEVLRKFRLIFESYTAFKDCQYLIRDVHFDVKKEEMTGIGHVEGMVKYNAVLENGELKAVEGPYKLYMSMEKTCGGSSISFFLDLNGNSLKVWRTSTIWDMNSTRANPIFLTNVKKWLMRSIGKYFRYSNGKTKLITTNQLKKEVMENKENSPQQGQANQSRGNTSKRGFASMDIQKQREIASKGGKAAHLSGNAHEFTSEEAREAGRKGGQARNANRQAAANRQA